MITTEDRVNLKKDVIPSVFELVSNIVPGKAVMAGLATDFSNESIENDENAINSDVNDSLCTAQTVPNVENQTKHNQINANRENQRYDILKCEYENLRQQYIELESQRCVQMANLENEVKKSQTKIKIQKEQIQYYQGKIHRIEKSEQSLKNLLDDFKERSILTAEAHATLEVNIFQYFRYSPSIQY